jgi:4,5-dihydroxyphthalate decarboxylase
MPAIPSFTIRGGAHPHVAGVPGRWGAFDLGYEVMNANDIFSAMLKSRPFEICEFSLANFLMLKAAGEDWLCALPIFPNRAFRHATLTVRRDSALARPEDLRGLRLGVEDYSMSAAVWVRGLLWDEYRVAHQDLTWVTPHDQRFPLPAGVAVQYDDAPLEPLLAAGRADAIIGMNLADARLPAEQRQFRPLLPNPLQEEARYFEKTGIFPMNHCVAIRRDVAKAHPGLSEAVARAYVSAKNAAYRAQTDPTRPPWADCARHPAFLATPRDPLQYGMTPANRTVVESLGRHLLRQGFIAAVPPVDSLFLPTEIAP